jgi:hypothetical protein
MAIFYSDSKDTKVALLPPLYQTYDAAYSRYQGLSDNKVPVTWQPSFDITNYQAGFSHERYIQRANARKELQQALENEDPFVRYLRKTLYVNIYKL